MATNHPIGLFVAGCWGASAATHVPIGSCVATPNLTRRYRARQRNSRAVSFGPAHYLHPAASAAKSLLFPLLFTIHSLSYHKLRVASPPPVAPATPSPRRIRQENPFLSPGGLPGLPGLPHLPGLPGLPWSAMVRRDPASHHERRSSFFSTIGSTTDITTASMTAITKAITTAITTASTVDSAVGGTIGSTGGRRCGLWKSEGAQRHHQM